MTNDAHERGQKTQQRYRVLSPHKFVNGEGIERTGWTDVGVGFKSADGEGFNVEIKPGISVSGRLVVRPWKVDAENDPGLKDEGPKQFTHNPLRSEKELV